MVDEKKDEQRKSYSPPLEKPARPPEVPAPDLVITLEGYNSSHERDGSSKRKK